MTVQIVDYNDRYRAAIVHAMGELQEYERSLSDDRPAGETIAEGHFSYLLGLCASKPGRIFLAVDDDALIGFIVVVQEREDDEDLHLLEAHRRYGLVTDLFVAEQCRRSGVASRLLESAECYCASQGLVVMRITALYSNSAARRFYERCDYRSYEVVYRKVIG